MSKLILVLGGTRSGKSDFAHNLAANSKTTTYLATGAPVDEEMKQRIAEHKKNRPKNWQTVEMDGQTITNCLKNCEGQAVIIDCLGNLLTRLMENNELDKLIEELPQTLEKNKQNFEQLIIVSNEVGLSLVSPHKSGRDFSDAIGLLNQNIASMADEVFLIVAGVPMKIK